MFRKLDIFSEEEGYRPERENHPSPHVLGREDLPDELQSFPDSREDSRKTRRIYRERRGYDTDHLGGKAA
eukprot:1332198-Amorphochlora_amoeboformis.AAC.2